MSIHRRPHRAAVRRHKVRAVLGALLVLGALVVADPAARAAAAFRSAARSGSSSARTRITIARPAGTQAGDVLVASVVENDDDPAFVAPAGWTSIRQDTIVNALRQAVYVRVATAAEPASYTWSLSTQRRIAGGISAYRGIDTSAPVDAHGAQVNTTASRRVTAPSVITTATGAVLVHLAAVNAEGTLSPPAGMTERWEAAARKAGSTRDATASSSDQIQASAGASGPRTATASRAGVSIGALLALRPAGQLGDGGEILVGAGDIALCSAEGDEATADVLDSVVADHPDAVVFTAGDNVVMDGTAAEFADCYDPTWGRHKRRTRPSAGNHDYRTPGAAGYYGYFGAAAGDPATGYYSYDLGAWHVVVLNSNCAEVGGCGAGSPQERWLRADLAASDAACTLAYWHHPRFTSGAKHGGDPAYQPFWQALYDYGAELVVSGHNHNYERFAPQTPAGAADAAFGIRQFVAGTGGADPYGFGAPRPNSEVRNSGTYGVLQLTLQDNGYEWQFLPAAGASFTDSGHATCHGLPSGAGGSGRRWPGGAGESAPS